MSRLFTAAALLALAVPVVAARQSTPSFSSVDRTRTDTKHLTLTTSVGPPAARGRLVLFLDVVPKPKMHVYAPEQKDVIPITLTLEPHPAVRAQAVKYPRVEKYFFAPLKETQLVYSKPFRLTVPISVTAGEGGAPLVVPGTVRYQACDESICYLPQTVKVEFTLPGMARLP